MRHARLRDRRVPLPPGVTELLSAHAGALSDARIEDTAARLGSSPEECRDAVTFFIRQAMLEAGGDHYRTLGVPRNADARLIRQHYHYLIRLFHPDRDTRSEGWENLYAPLINEAWNQLRVPQKRAEYDATLDAPDAFDAIFSRSGEGQAYGAGGADMRQASPSHARPRGAGGPSGAAAGRGIWRAVGDGFSRLLLTWSPRGIAGLLAALSVLVLVWMWQLQPRQAVVRVQDPAAAAERARATQTGQKTEPDAAGDAGQDGDAALAATTEVDGLLGESAGVRRAEVASVGRSRSLAEREADIEARIRERLAAASRAVLGNRPPPAAAPASRVTSSQAVTASTREESQSQAMAESRAAAALPGESPGDAGEQSSASEFSHASAAGLSSSFPSRTETGTGTGTEAETATVLAGDPLDADMASEADRSSDVASAPLESTQSEPTQPESARSEPARLEAAPPAPAQLAPLDKAQLTALLQIFRETYEAGDAAGFAVLFDAGAITTDAEGREAIYALYEGFFARPETRQITFERMRWKSRGPYRSRGRGKAEVVTVPYTGGDPAAGVLTMTFEVAQTRAGPVITALHYE